MAAVEFVHVDFGGSFSRTVLEDGSAMDLSGATKISLEFFDEPGDPIVAFDSLADAANFDLTDLSDGIVRFLWTPETWEDDEGEELDLIDSGRTRQQHFCRLVVFDAVHEDGWVVPEMFTVEFWR